MNFLQDWPIKRKLMLMAMLASTLALLVACAAFITYEQYSSRQNLKRKLAVVARITGANCAAPLEFDDQAEAEQRLYSLAADPKIIYARLSDSEGRIYAQYQRGVDSIPANAPPPEIPLAAIKVEGSVTSGGEKVGSLLLAYDGLELNAKLSQYLFIVCLVLAASAMAAFFLSTQLQKLISIPLTNLARTASDVAREKNYSLRAPAGGKDEIGSLIQGLNEMLFEIQTRDDELRAARENLERRVEKRTEELAKSVSLLHATFESTEDGILVVDLEDRVVAFNTPLLRMWGLERDELEVGKPNNFFKYAAPKLRDSELALQRVKSHLQQPDKQAYDVLELADGRVFERFINPQLVGDKCVGCVMNYRDITERRRAEDVLRRTEALYRRAIAGADAVPYAYDYRTRTYVFIGNNIEQLLGYTAEEVKPDLWAGITKDCTMRGAALGMTKHQAADLVRRGEIREWRCDMLVQTRSGELRWISDSSVQNIDEHGNIVGSMGILQDINDRKRAEAELAYERDLLKAMMDNFPDAIYFKDLQSRFVRVSRSKLLETHKMALSQHELSGKGKNSADGNGLPWHLSSVERFAEWLPGRSDFDFLPEPRAQDALKDEQEITATGKPLLGKLETLPYPDGTVRWCLTSKLPWLDKDGKIIGTFGASKDITALKEAEAKLEAAHREVVEISRRAGMAEVATSVLHNVGNVLNSVNTSAGLVSEIVRNSKSGDVAKVVALLEKNKGDLAGFMKEPGRAGQLIAFMSALSRKLDSERTTVLTEVEELTRNIEHIKEIVAMQQSYSSVAGVEEYHSLSHLIDDALRVQGAGLARHKVEVVRHFEQLPEVLVDKHKVLQILINLISNAKYALTSSDAQRTVTVSLAMHGKDKVRIGIADNGVGIAPENLTRIFAHGFTTRAGGHGFGLHSGALAAQEMGGRLSVHSDGPGRGATFTLELPAHVRIST